MAWLRGPPHRPRLRAGVDTLPEWHQRNYERGRQVAAYVGERAVKWRKTELLASLLRRTGGYTLSGEVSADVMPIFFLKR